MGAFASAVHPDPHDASRAICYGWYGVKSMHVEIKQGALVLRLGNAFTACDAERVVETMCAFAPLSRVTLDFAKVRRFEDAAFFPIAKALGVLAEVEVELRGLTLHHLRLLRYLEAGAVGSTVN